MATTIDVNGLVKRLQAAKDAYYNHQPIMSDAQYDALEDELRRIDSQHPFFSKVGAALPVGGAWPEVKHSIPMTSLNKAQPQTDPNVQPNIEMITWFKGCNLTPADEVVEMDKLDGASVELCYVKRRLVQAVTRGDGITGQDITRNVMLMQGAIKMLPPTMPDGTPTPDTVFVRGEIVCLISDFNKYFQGESNPRNTASGTSKRQTGHEKCSHLTIITYDLMPNGQGMVTKETELVTLVAFGFHVPKWSKTPATAAHVETIYQGYIVTIRKGLDYIIDGVVVMVNSLAKRDSLGDLNGNPKGAIAYKFPHDAKPTTLRAIRWQVGNSGRITPVAEFDSVNLAGANVVQASLHNISMIEALCKAHNTGHLGVGDKILVSRRNDVIPYVEELLIPDPTGAILSVPTTCPSCTGPLTRNGEYLVCKSDECPAQATGKVKRWIKKNEVLHFGDSLVEAVVEAGLVTDPADLYTLDPAQVADLEIGGRKVGGTADKAIRNLRAKMTIPLPVLVGSLGIDLIGRDMAKILVDAGFNSLSKMTKATIPQIAAIAGVGDTKARAFVMGFAANLGLIAKLLGNGIQIAIVSGPLVGKSFCMTGFRDAALADAITQAGGNMKGGVSRGLSYLIALDKGSNSGKMGEARKNGVTIIDVDEAWNLTGQSKPQ